ncbi:hypothetical protein ABZ897_18915 [Nonomuraea sp. NPDC046802]|uniref:hypothetical protein n=1 Tax=Nonomuraea sp. NPDC046802 TaxID=3154919 RepID=UPI00340E0EE7
MNTDTRRTRFAALALAGAFAGSLFLPLGQGVATASAGYPTVEAGGPPAPRHRAAPRVRVQAAPRIIREKPVLRRHHRNWEHQNIRVILENDNENFNRGDRRHRFDHRQIRPRIEEHKEEHKKEPWEEQWSQNGQ